MSTSSVSGSSSSGSGSSGLITPQTVDTSGGLTTGSTLTNDGAGGNLQLTGLSSGIDTNALIQAELAEKEEPLINMENTISSMENVDTTLTNIQTAMDTVITDLEDLSDPTLYFQSQTVNSTDSSLVSATTNAQEGTPIGSSTIQVSQLASASQATVAYTAPTSGSDNLYITIGGTTQTVAVSAGESLQNIANSINGDQGSDATAYATVLNGQLVVSARQTGDGGTTGMYNATTNPSGTDSGNPITVTSDSGSASVVSQVAGQDAVLYINGSTTPTYSQSDTVTDAVPGLTLTLNGITGSTPVTLTTGTPAVDTDSITKAVQQFVSDYNGAVSGIEDVINTAPTSESDSSDASPYTNNLFGDPELEDFLANMRDALDSASTTDATSGTLTLADIGISTGESNGTVSQDAVDGLLQVDTTKLAAALQSDPDGVKNLLQSFSTSLQGVVNNEAGPYGSLYTRINGNETEISSMQSQLNTQQQMFNIEEQQMQAEWAQVESTLGTLDDQKTSLTAFLDAENSSSSSSS